MSLKMNVERIRTGMKVLCVSLVLCSLSMCAEEPVGRDYFMNPELLKGGEKPSPAPVIAGLTESGDYIVVDFTG
ncbi:MAG TPA: hypothetical protein PLT75_17955, partial [Spirochaetota bacterium]|nr:hypothetical protein [Spirochaetota bacterium]